MNTSSRRIAVSGMMVALGAAVMLLGGVIPIATFCCPAIAGLALIPLVFDCGRAYALSAYGAIALLSLMLCPDKEAALLFCFLGYYPVVKWTFDGRIKRKWLRRLAKLLLWNTAIGIMYALIFFVFRLDQIMAVFAECIQLGFIALFIHCHTASPFFLRFAHTLRIQRKSLLHFSDHRRVCFQHSDQQCSRAHIGVALFLHVIQRFGVSGGHMAGKPRLAAA